MGSEGKILDRLPRPAFEGDDDDDFPTQDAYSSAVRAALEEQSSRQTPIVSEIPRYAYTCNDGFFRERALSSCEISGEGGFFRERALRQSRPVVVTGIVNRAECGWLTEDWCLEVLRQRLRDIPWTARRGGDYSTMETVETTLGVYLDAIANADVDAEGMGAFCGFYGANNMLPPSMIPYISPPALLYPGHTFRATDTRIWIGGEGSGAPTHCDEQDNFIAQVWGTKTVMLAPPHCAREIGASRVTACLLSSAVRPFDDDDDDASPFLRVTLNRGDLLYLPAGWFHATRNETASSCSINFWSSACFAALGVVLPELGPPFWPEQPGSAEELISRRRSGETAQEPAATATSKSALTSYWEGRFLEDDRSQHGAPLPSPPPPSLDDWIASSPELLPHILPHLPQRPDARLLVVGCGTSFLSAELYRGGAGFTNILSTDISEHAIETQRRRHPDLTWECDDATDMRKCHDGEVEAVVDKGCCDTLLYRCRNGHKRFGMVCHMFAEVARVLTDGGVYIMITPRRKVPWLREAPSDFPRKWDWAVTTHGVAAATLPGLLERTRREKETVYVHVCKKGARRGKVGRALEAERTLDRHRRRLAMVERDGDRAQRLRGEACRVCDFLCKKDEEENEEGGESQWVLGRVVSRRMASKRLVFYTLAQAESEDEAEELLQARFEASEWLGTDFEAGETLPTDEFFAMHKLVSPGDTVAIEGRPGFTRSGQYSLLARRLVTLALAVPRQL